jgi:hypothetical protein
VAPPPHRPQRQPPKSTAPSPQPPAPPTARPAARLPAPARPPAASAPAPAAPAALPAAPARRPGASGAAPCRGSGDGGRRGCRSACSTSSTPAWGGGAAARRHLTGRGWVGRRTAEPKPRLSRETTCARLLHKPLRPLLRPPGPPNPSARACVAGRPHISHVTTSCVAASTPPDAAARAASSRSRPSSAPGTCARGGRRVWRGSAGSAVPARHAQLWEGCPSGFRPPRPRPAGAPRRPRRPARRLARATRPPRPRPLRGHRTPRGGRGLRAFRMQR